MAKPPTNSLPGAIRAGLGCSCPRCGKGNLYRPPYWVHAVLWLPLILIVTLGLLRPMKGLMIALQYYHKAEERRFGGTRAP